MSQENPTGHESGTPAAEEAQAEREGSLPGPSGAPASWNPEETGDSGELPGSAAAPEGWEEETEGD